MESGEVTCSPQCPVQILRVPPILTLEEARQERHYRFKPDVRDGRVRIRMEVKPKTGGKFTVKGIWKCPPMDQELWGGMSGLYTPQVVVGGRGSV